MHKFAKDNNYYSPMCHKEFGPATEYGWRGVKSPLHRNTVCNESVVLIALLSL